MYNIKYNSPCIRFTLIVKKMIINSMEHYRQGFEENQK